VASGQYPAWLAGMNITADLLAAMLPLSAWKTGTTSRSSTTSPAADPDLSLTVVSSATYIVDLSLVYDADTAGDLKYAWTIPSGGTLSLMAAAMLTGAAATFTDDQMIGLSNTGSFGGLGTGNNGGALLRGTLTTAGSGGTFSFNWSQNTSSGTATRLFAGCVLVARRVA
jgi:hypothetical protein